MKRLKTKYRNIAIIGLGYVGLPLAILADRKGYNVTGIDIDEKKVDLINKKIVPFIEPRITELIKRSKIVATTSFNAVSKADIVVICVPTPVHDDHKPNLKPLMAACESITKFIKKGQLIILESTVNPGVSDEIVIPLLEKASGLKNGQDFYFAHCPERINPGDKNYDVSNIARVVGSNDAEGLKRAVDFYTSIVDANIKPMQNLKEAEAVKIVENCFRDINIAFVNELAMSFSRLGIDVKNVIDGAATKPYSFMPHYSGCGVGGHCIAVDPYYLIEYAKSSTGFQHKFLKLAREINNGMPKFTVDLLKYTLKHNKIDIKKAKVTVLGLAYKADIDDCRESPSFEVLKELKEECINVKVFDPYVADRSTVESLDKSLDDADAIVITTAHKEFKSLNPEYLLSKGIKVVVDGRNCLDKDLFEIINKYEDIPDRLQSKKKNNEDFSI